MMAFQQLTAKNAGSSYVNHFDSPPAPRLADQQLESCASTEGRLASEFRRNPYGRAMLLATMARLRADRAEQEELLEEATALLRRGKPRDIDWHRRTQYREMLNNGYRQLMDRERTRGSFHPLGGIGTMRVME